MSSHQRVGGGGVTAISLLSATLQIDTARFLIDQVVQTTTEFNINNNATDRSFRCVNID